MMTTAIMKRRIERSRHYYDIPSENTAVILTADLFRKMKSLPLSLAQIALDTIHMSYPNLAITDVILLEAIGNVFNSHDRLICSWIERCNIQICDTRIGKQLQNGELPHEAAAELSVDEAVNLFPFGTKAYRIDSDGNSWFRFRPIETVDLEIEARFPNRHRLGSTRSYQDFRDLPSFTGGKTALRPMLPSQLRPKPDFLNVIMQKEKQDNPSLSIRPSVMTVQKTTCAKNKTLPERIRLAVKRLISTVIPSENRILALLQRNLAFG